MENAYDEDKRKEGMKTILFDEDGQPVSEVAAADAPAGGAEEAAGGQAGAAGAAEADASGGAAKQEHHRTTVKELKERITALDLEAELLKAELDKARKETQSYIGLAQRTKADFDNFKKRNSEQNQRLRGEGLAEGALLILPVYDALTKASEMISDENTLKGLLMIGQRLADSLKALGIEKIECLGKDFDPDFHNAVMNEEAKDPGQKGKVIEVYQEGFIMDGRVLRYAMVKVAI